MSPSVRLLIMLVVAGVAIGTSAAAPLRASDRAAVSVSIDIAPIASVEFPDGYEFVLVVPDKKSGKGHEKSKGKGHDKGKGKGHDKDHDKHDGIEPILIPFKVRGNALATVSVRPLDFMRIYRGPWLGSATGPHGDKHKHTKGKGHHHSHGRGHGHRDSDELGYNVLVKFPISSPNKVQLAVWGGHSSWPGFASLPGEKGAGTSPLTANLSNRPNGVYGVIVIVSQEDWTKDGRDAKQGKYRGAVEVLITAGDQ